jgi:hypothetical protein
MDPEDTAHTSARIRKKVGGTGVAARSREIYEEGEFEGIKQ